MRVEAGESRDEEERAELYINIYEGTGDGRWPEKATVLAATRISVVSCLFRLKHLECVLGPSPEPEPKKHSFLAMKFPFRWAICRSRKTTKRIK
jgi:hypothetical protein